MALPKNDLYKAALRALGPHGPDAVLALMLVITAVGAGLAGLDLWFTAFVICFIFLIYAVRQTLGERHKERTAELAVEKSEAELRVYREKQLAKMSKAKAMSLALQEERPADKGNRR